MSGLRILVHEMRLLVHGYEVIEYRGIINAELGEYYFQKKSITKLIPVYLGYVILLLVLFGTFIRGC